jgi:hypothetical protein
LYLWLLRHLFAFEKYTVWPHSFRMTDQEHIAALIRSNDELRGVLIVAGREMGRRKIMGERQRKVLELMRQAVREGRARR